VLYETTAAGRTLVTQDRQRRDHWLSQRLNGLTPEQRQILDRAVPILNQLALD
jgi:DNA-binding MarR family transcriptional regulator